MMICGVRRIVVGTIALSGLFLAGPALAGVVNVDFAATGADGTHSGADGVLSTAGNIWNGVLFNAPALNVADEGGIATPVDVIPTPFFGGGTDGSATNDLQDSGLLGNGFDIADLSAASTYSVAVYGGTFMGFSITDANGTVGALCVSTPTYSLPGTAGSDYCIYNGLAPFDLGGGVMGIRISGLDGLVSGFQIEGPFGGGEPEVPALGPLAALALALSLAGTSVGWLAKRQS